MSRKVRYCGCGIPISRHLPFYAYDHGRATERAKMREAVEALESWELQDDGRLVNGPKTEKVWIERAAVLAIFDKDG